MKHLFCLFFLFAISTFSHGANDVINKDIVFKKYDRKIDVSTQLVKAVHKVTIENTGSSPVKYFLFVLTEEEYEKLSYIGAQVSYH